jgi:hypothetical protein
MVESYRPRPRVNSESRTMVFAAASGIMSI